MERLFVRTLLKLFAKSLSLCFQLFSLATSASLGRSLFVSRSVVRTRGVPHTTPRTMRVFLVPSFTCLVLCLCCVTHVASQPTSVPSSFTCVSSGDQGGSCFVASCAQLRAPRCRPGYRTSRCTATSPRRNESLVFLRTATRRPSRQRGTAVITMDRSSLGPTSLVTAAHLIPGSTAKIR